MYIQRGIKANHVQSVLGFIVCIHVCDKIPLLIVNTSEIPLFHFVDFILDTPSRFSAIFTKEVIFVTFCLQSCTSSPF